MINHENVEIVMTKRNKEMLLYKGHAYHLRRKTNKTKQWRCRNRNCSGSVETSLTNIFEKENPHECEPNFGQNEIFYLKNEAKKRSMTTRESSRDIIDNLLLQISPETIPFLPKYRSLVNFSSRNKKNEIIITNSRDDIPEIIKKTSRGENFYLFDSGIDDIERVVVFSTETNIIHMSYNKIWICDGTFRSAPRGFYQIYTIMAIINQKSYPLAYFIMKKKSLESYKIAFRFLKSKLKSMPELILIDFEAASLNCLREIFQETRVEGCYFHFSQLIWRRIQALSLSVLYKKEKQFRLCVKMIISLAFVPIESVHYLGEDLSEFFKNIGFSEELNNLWLWFKNLYLNKENISLNIFSVKFWSINERFMCMDPLTTNSIEGWHRSLNMNIRIPHPSILEMGLELLREQRKVEFMIIKNLYTNPINNNLLNDKNKLIKNILERNKGSLNITHLEAIAGLIDIRID
ncbi:hypothetical protein DMUE_5521 [Dictyocoela muelleri]|nr:hypothetical protein DMUE_5521 [Dictyocoela muelleri]